MANLHIGSSDLSGFIFLGLRARGIKMFSTMVENTCLEVNKTWSNLSTDAAMLCDSA